MNLFTKEEIIKACYQVPGQTWPIELGWLYDTFSTSKSHVEIGTYCGRSLLASCGGMKEGSSVISIDDKSEWINNDWVLSVLNATKLLIPNYVSIESIEMNSIDASRKCYEDNKKFDSIFIDGCHEYAESKADIESWISMLNTGGIICGHDYWPVHIGVMDAVNEVFNGKHSIFSGTRIWYYKL